MKALNSIAGALCLGTAAFSLAATPAQATLTLLDSFATTKAIADIYGGSGGHAFWLPTLNSDLGGLTTDRWVFSGTGVTDEYSDDVAGTTVLNMRGTLRPNNDNTGNYQLSANLWFVKDADQSHAGKKELNGSAYVPAPGAPVDPNGPGTQKWVYYNLVESINGLGKCGIVAGGEVDCTTVAGAQDSRLTATGSVLTGFALDLLQRPDDGRYPLQVGDGANNKNILFGASMWFGYDVLTRSQRVRDLLTSGANTRGDVNVDIDYPIPEPATLTLFGLGLAGLGFARRRKAA